MAPSPLAFTEIEAWCRLSGVELSPWELDTILMMDSAALSEVNKK